MAGHSKWANIQHRKGVQDARRGKLFTKLIREITIAARTSGGDAAANPRLRTAIDKALSNNMSKDTVQKAIKRGTGEGSDTQYESVRYEGYGPGGVAVMVDCTTDNRNRTVGEVRHAFSKCGGNLGTDGSVAYLFSKVGQMSYPDSKHEDKILELALDAGAKDVVVADDGSLEVLTEPDDFDAVRKALEDAGLPPAEAVITMRAATSTSVDRDTAEKMMKLLELLEDLDDVQEVYSNADIPADILAELS